MDAGKSVIPLSFKSGTSDLESLSGLSNPVFVGELSHLNEVLFSVLSSMHKRFELINLDGSLRK
jgi:hypothetical protein